MKTADSARGTAPLLHEYSGAVHVHSIYSDGRGTVPEIIAAAECAGLDFLALTDHGTLDGRRYEGWHGQGRPASDGAAPTGHGLLLIVGQEVSPEKEHYLAFGLDGVVPAVLGESDQYVSAVSRLGGFGFIAHPFDRGNPLFGVPSFEWRPASRWTEQPGAPLPGGPFTGIEVWNYYSEALASGRSWPAVVRGLLFPGVYGPDPDPRGLALWDALGRLRPTPGIGGLDAHGARGAVLGHTPRAMTYDFAFRAVRTNVLLERPLVGAAHGDEKAILEALRRGRSMIVMAGRGPAKGARFWGRPAGSPEGGAALPGDEVPSDPLDLIFTVPAPARLIIRRDGAVVAEGRGRRLVARADRPGVYRVEALRRWGRWRPWIYSNPIYLRV